MNDDIELTVDVLIWACLGWLMSQGWNVSRVYKMDDNGFIVDAWFWKRDEIEYTEDVSLEDPDLPSIPGKLKDEAVSFLNIPKEYI